MRYSILMCDGTYRYLDVPDDAVLTFGPDLPFIRQQMGVHKQHYLLRVHDKKKDGPIIAAFSQVVSYWQEESVVLTKFNHPGNVADLVGATDPVKVDVDKAQWQCTPMP